MWNYVTCCSCAATQITNTTPLRQSHTSIQAQRWQGHNIHKWKTSTLYQVSCKDLEKPIHQTTMLCSLQLHSHKHRHSISTVMARRPIQHKQRNDFQKKKKKRLALTFGDLIESEVHRAPILLCGNVHFGTRKVFIRLKAKKFLSCQKCAQNLYSFTLYYWVMGASESRTTHPRWHMKWPLDTRCIQANWREMTTANVIQHIWLLINSQEHLGLVMATTKDKPTVMQKQTEKF